MLDVSAGWTLANKISNLKHSHYSISPPCLRSDNILSHENLAVWPFSKEVLWSLSFPGGSVRFVIYCSVAEENKWDHSSFCHARLSSHTHHSFVVTNQSVHTNHGYFVTFHSVPFFHKARTALIFPGIPVLLCVEDMLSKTNKHFLCDRELECECAQAGFF